MALAAISPILKLTLLARSLTPAPPITKHRGSALFTNRPVRALFTVRPTRLTLTLKKVLVAGARLAEGRVVPFGGETEIWQALFTHIGVTALCTVLLARAALSIIQEKPFATLFLRTNSLFQGEGLLTNGAIPLILALLALSRTPHTPLVQQEVPLAAGPSAQAVIRFRESPHACVTPIESRAIGARSVAIHALLPVSVEK